MRLKVPVYGFALALIGFFVPLVIFAAFLPSLINAEPVKKRFIEELKSWIGAEAQLHGPVTIESFFSLSLNAENVEFRGFRGFPSLKGVKAGQIVARISWMDLLSGKLDFDKIKINDAVVLLRSMDKGEMADALKFMLTASSQTPFAAFVLTDSQVKIDDAGTAEPSEVSVKSLVVKVRKSDGRIDLGGLFTWGGEDVELDIRTRAVPPSGLAPSVPLRLKVGSPHLTGSFNGEATLAKGWSANGQLEVATPNALELSNWTGQEMQFDVPEEIKLAGTLDLSESRIQLQSGVFGLAGEEASGDLNVVLTDRDARVEGALAFDGIDLAKFWGSGSDRQPSTNPEQTSFAKFLANANLDLRVSANSMRWDTLTMGAAAFTLSGRGGVLSSEIAQLDLLGGSILGHAEADFRASPPHLRARVTAEKINAAQLTTHISQKDWLTGQADANIEVDAEGWTAAQLLDSVSMKARIEFPEGGQMRLDLLRLARSASAEAQDGWEDAALSWWAFNDLRFKISLQSNRLHCADLTLVATDGVIHGSGEVDFAEQKLDWRLKVNLAGADDSLDEKTQATSNRIPEANLSIKGPWARPSIRLGAEASRASGNTFARPGASVVEEQL